MIIGIGTDIANISRIAATLAEHGERFVNRCFSAVEQAHAAQSKDPASTYAKRWAAKEACAKALGLGIRDSIYLKDIAVENDALGKPALRLSGGARERLAALVPAGMTPRIDVSLSDEPPIAMAFVIISAEKSVHI